MGSAVQLADAVDELYGGDVAAFTAERNRLVGQARKDGEKDLAKQIGGLAKPTRSAYAVNLLVRHDAAVGAELTELGEELRAAEQAGDAPRMRELATRRRRLVDDLVAHAFELVGQQDPPAGLREEVVATLNATLADPDVARQILAGSLVRPVRWEGFGSVPLTRISALPDASAPSRSKASPRVSTKPGSNTRDDERAAKAAAERAAVVAAERERRRAEDLAEARTAADEADSGLERAGDQVAQLEGTARDLEADLSEAHRRLDRARIDLRRARSRQREAQRDLDKLES